MSEKLFVQCLETGDGQGLPSPSTVACPMQKYDIFMTVT